MKTAEETLHNHLPAADDSGEPSIGEAMAECYTWPMIIRAMKAYATAAIQADREDCAEKATAYLMKEQDSGCDCEPIADKASIIDRPLPNLK